MGYTELVNLIHSQLELKYILYRLDETYIDVLNLVAFDWKDKLDHLKAIRLGNDVYYDHYTLKKIHEHITVLVVGKFLLKHNSFLLLDNIPPLTHIAQNIKISSSIYSGQTNAFISSCFNECDLCISKQTNWCAKCVKIYENKSLSYCDDLDKHMKNDYHLGLAVIKLQSIIICDKYKFSGECMDFILIKI